MSHTTTNPIPFSFQYLELMLLIISVTLFEMLLQCWFYSSVGDVFKVGLAKKQVLHMKKYTCLKESAEQTKVWDNNVIYWKLHSL